MKKQNKRIMKIYIFNNDNKIAHKTIIIAIKKDKKYILHNFIIVKIINILIIYKNNLRVFNFFKSVNIFMYLVFNLNTKLRIFFTNKNYFTSIILLRPFF